MEILNLESKHEGKYRFDIFQMGDKFYAKQFNLNAKKECNQQINYYRFTTAQRRDEWVLETMKRIRAWNERKEERRQARLAFKNPAKIGDILCMSWGYEQTNVDFYQVIAVKEKMIEMREIGQRTVEGSYQTHGMACEVQPAPGAFIKDAPILRKRVKQIGDEYGVDMTSYADAYKVRPEEKHYKSWYA